MMTIKRGNCEWLKKTLKINEGTKRLRIHNKYGWNFLDYLYTPKRLQNLRHGETSLKNSTHCLRMFKN
jgi:hypothetical protein